jgi:glutathionylspermidine synthase
MKKLILLILIVTGIFLPVQLANANILMKAEDVASMQINRLSGGSRVFRENDGIEESVIKKVVEWITTANSKHEPTEIVNKETPITLLKMNMKNGDVVIIEPAYNCYVQNKTKI